MTSVGAPSRLAQRESTRLLGILPLFVSQQRSDTPTLVGTVTRFCRLLIKQERSSTN